MVNRWLAAYSTSSDGHIGITIDMAATHRVIMAATAAIDITHLSTTKVGRVCARPHFVFTNGTATDNHVGISSKAISQCLAGNHRISLGRQDC